MIICFPVFVHSILSPEWVCGLKPFPAIYKQQFSFAMVRSEFDKRSGADSLSHLTSFQCLISILNPVLFIFCTISWVHIFLLCFEAFLLCGLVSSTPFYIYMSINTCVYLQTSNYFSCDITLCILTDILSLEGKDSASQGRAKLRSHRCLLWCACVYVKLLATYKGSRTFLAISVQP